MVVNSTKQQRPGGRQSSSSHNCGGTSTVRANRGRAEGDRAPRVGERPRCRGRRLPPAHSWRPHGEQRAPPHRKSPHNSGEPKLRPPRAEAMRLAPGGQREVSRSQKKAHTTAENQGLPVSGGGINICSRGKKLRPAPEQQKTKPAQLRRTKADICQGPTACTSV